MAILHTKNCLKEELKQKYKIIKTLQQKKLIKRNKCKPCVKLKENLSMMQKRQSKRS